MTILRNNAESGATAGDGTAVTAANSGGASGKAFDLVPTAGTTPFLFDNSTAHHGTYSYEFVSGAITSYGQFTISSTDFSGTCYVKLDGAPVASDYAFMRLYSASTMQVSIGLMSTGRIRALENGLVTAFTAATPLPSDGNFYRIEFNATQSPTAADIKCSYFLGDSTTAIEALSKLASANTGSAPFDVFRVGKLTTTGTTPYHIDEIGYEVAAAGALNGPAPAIGAPTVNAGADQYPTAGATVSVSSTESGSFSGGLWSFTKLPVGAPSPAISSPTTAGTNIVLPNVGGPYELRRRLTYTGGTVDSFLTLWVNPGPAGDVLVQGELDTAAAYPNEGGAANRTAALNDTSTATGIAEPTASAEKKFIMRPFGVGPMSLYPEGYSRSATLTRTVTLYKEDGTTVVQAWTVTPGLEIANIAEPKLDVTSGLATLTGVNDAATLVLRRALVVGFKWA